MAHEGYTGLSSLEVCAVALTGVRNAQIAESQAQDMQAADNDLWPKGSLGGGAAAAGSVSTDKPNHGLTLASTGTSTFTEHQGITTKVVSITSCVITSVGRTGVARGSGRGQTNVAFVAYSADGSTSPVTWPA